MILIKNVFICAVLSIFFDRTLVSMQQTYAFPRNNFETCVNEVECGNFKDAFQRAKHHGLYGNQLDCFNRSLFFLVIFALYQYERCIDSDNYTYDFDQDGIKLLQYLLDHGADINQRFESYEEDPCFYEYWGVTPILYATWMAMSPQFPHRLTLLKIFKSYKSLNLYNTRNSAITFFCNKKRNPLEFLRHDWDTIEVRDFPIREMYDLHEATRDDVFKILYPEEYRKIHNNDKEKESPQLFHYDENNDENSNDEDLPELPQRDQDNDDRENGQNDDNSGDDN